MDGQIADVNSIVQAFQRKKEVLNADVFTRGSRLNDKGKVPELSSDEMLFQIQQVAHRELCDLPSWVEVEPPLVRSNVDSELLTSTMMDEVPNCVLMADVGRYCDSRSISVIQVVCFDAFCVCWKNEKVALPDKADASTLSVRCMSELLGRERCEQSIISCPLDKAERQQQVCSFHG